jgi:hypothetical protein
MTIQKNGKTSSAERNNGRKPKYSVRDRRTLKRTVSKNHTNTAVKVKTEFNIHLADSISTKKNPTRASQIQHPWYSCNC